MIKIDSIIYNITPSTFGGQLRNGDMIGALNFVENVNRIHNKTSRIYIPEDSIYPLDFNYKFYNWLMNNTELLSINEGSDIFPYDQIRLWDYRILFGDILKIKNSKSYENKLIIFPIFDAKYNEYRNWNKIVFSNILNHFMKYEGRKIICCSNILYEEVIPSCYEISYDFHDNINHILTCDTYVGGDTGMSHFSWVLYRGPQKLFYVSHKYADFRASPLYLFSEHKGEIIYYE